MKKIERMPVLWRDIAFKGYLIRMASNGQIFIEKDRHLISWADKDVNLAKHIIHTLTSNPKRRTVKRRNPLKAGYSRKTISRNIRHMVRTGRRVKVGVAAALNKARATFKRRYPGRALPGFLRPKRAHNAAKRRRSAPLRAIRMKDIGQVRAQHLLAGMGGRSRQGHMLYVAKKPLACVYGKGDAMVIARLVSKHLGIKVQVRK